MRMSSHSLSWSRSLVGATTHSSLAIAVATALLLSGCGSAGVRYTAPLTEQYEQIPLLRPAAAKTFSVVIKGKELVGEALVIEGMTRVTDGGDLQVVVDYQGTTATAGALRSGYVCVANDTTTADGKSIDLTMAKNYQSMGFNESIIRAPLHLVVSYWYDGSLAGGGSLQVLKADGAVISSTDLTYMRTLRVGKPLEKSYPFQEMMPVASASGSFGQDSGSGQSDAASRTAQGYLDGAFVDYQFVRRNDYLPRSAVEKSMKAMSQTPDSPGKKAALAAWEQAASAGANDVRNTISKAQDHLTQQYASGPRKFLLPIAEIKDNAAFAQANATIRALEAVPAAERGSKGNEALTQLEAVHAALKPEDIRARAAILYDRAVVQYLLGDFAAVEKSLLAARAENAKENDGFFSSSGKELSAKIDVLEHSAQDRAKRLAAKP
jgi:hypothetical protein